MNRLTTHSFIEGMVEEAMRQHEAEVKREIRVAFRKAMLAGILYALFMYVLYSLGVFVW